MSMRFIRDRKGGVAIAAALTLLPAMAMTGAAVDYSRATNARSELQVLLDAAAVSAVARETTFTRKEYAEAYVRDHLSDLPSGMTLVDVVAVEEIEPGSNAPRLRIRATVSMPTTFAGVVGVNTIDIAVETQAVVSGKKYEVVLVVDVTGSMKGNRIRALRESAESFVATLLASDSAREQIRVGIVPYSSAVNIGRERISWLDADADPAAPGVAPAERLSAADGADAVVQNRYVFDESEVKEAHCRGTNTTWDASLSLCYIGTLSEWTGVGACPGVTRGATCYVADAWAGCVMERAGTSHELTDATPITASFRPYYWGSWKGIGGHAGGGNASFNTYLPGPLDESHATNANGNNGRGPNLGCPKNELISFTNDRTLLIDEIRGFEAWHRGGTLGHVGMLWGWRMLSPDWRGLWTDATAPHDDDEWPHDYGTSETEKIVVFMTDGVNGFFSGMAPSNDSDYTAYGRLSDTADFNRSNNRQRLDDRMQTVCTAMRAEGIEIFTVGFELSDNSARDLLAGCASSRNHDFTSDVKTLVSHFTTIARDISERRIALTR